MGCGVGGAPGGLHRGRRRRRVIRSQMSVGNNESASDPGAAARGAGRWSSRRRGVTSVLAMLYLLLFSALALGFYAQTNLSVQIVRGEFKSGEAQVATESGLRFIRFHL